MRPPTIPTTIPVNRDDSKQQIIMKSLYNSLIEHREPKTHRILIQLFMCLPSRKDFPEYFNIISKPIAMNKIRERIERHIYPDEEACVEDFKLMFSNCKFFNEDDSQIYMDAQSLENILYKRKEQLQFEHSNKSSRDSRDATKEANSFNSTKNSSNSAPQTTTANSTINAIPNSNNNFNNNNSSPSIKSERLNNHSSNSNNHATTNNSASNVNNKDNSYTKDQSIKDNTLSQTPTTNSANSGSTSNNINNSNSTSNFLTSKTDHPSTPKKSSTNMNSNSNNNGISNTNTAITQQSDSTNQSTNDQQSCIDDLDTSVRVNHIHHNETSMDSSSNLSADLLASTPVEKCSLNTRRGRNADAPKRQLLTGYIIYASEIRKQVIDKNPNQNFGDISRLVGNEWKALPHDIRSKYDQRALIHNKRVRERAQRELNTSAADGSQHLSTNGLSTPKMTKRKLAKLAKEQMRQHHLSISGHDESSTQSPRISQEHSSSMVSQVPSSTYKHPHHQHSQPQSNPQATSSKNTTVETSTQTIAIRFVEPPTKKRLVYSDTFRKYIESLQVPNKDLLAEEMAPERPAEPPTHWLGAGIGRHESPEAALWALRDFMLQDAVTMRRSMEPYL